MVMSVYVRIYTYDACMVMCVYVYDACMVMPICVVIFDDVCICICVVIYGDVCKIMYMCGDIW